MKKPLSVLILVLAVGMTAAFDADARRLGGRSIGMQRQNVAPPKQPPQGANQAAPSQTAPAAGTPAAGAAATAAAAPKRSWMGPVAGLAAGLGIAALASHFGFGEALANMLTVGLLIMVVLAVIGFVMRRRMAPGAAPGAGLAGVPGGVPASAPGRGSLIGSNLLGGSAGLAAAREPMAAFPPGFDKAGFERSAREQFALLQEANDAGDLGRLREYLTPEMFEVVRAEVAERGGAAQKTEVFGLQADVLEVVQEADRYIVSVRFTGSVREQAGADVADLDEVWHLTKPSQGAGGWVIAGIQQAG